MTVLETEEDTDKRSVPPRKKFCLSLSNRERTFSNSIPQPPHTSSRGGLFDRSDFLYSTGKMMNGYRNQLNNQDGSYDISGLGTEGLKIATLCNLGNTCFLNSVIYTLRFAPSFLHNLHHLATDLSNLNDKQLQTKIKSSSLGRTGVSLTASGSRSWSSKDLLALAGPTGELNKPRIQIATEKLHSLFMALRVSESRENCEPYQPDAFLQALREVNPIFEGNQQQDAHELLVCLLDNIRETFQLLVRHRESQFGQNNASFSEISAEQQTDVQSEDSNSSKRSVRKSRKKKKITSRGSSICLIPSNTNGVSSSRPYENGHVEFSESNGDIGNHRPESKKCFISEDFEGISLLRTTCLECEHVTERKETFCDICVPIDVNRSNEKDDEGRTVDSSEVYRRAVVTSEFLVGRDKYWCARCLRYNEARRAVCFPCLPRLLILQLKRFSTKAGSMEKINNHMPTPLTLQCFCEECYNKHVHGNVSAKDQMHEYKLYSVIMHQGATMTAGHYVAYTRLPDESALAEYYNCDRDSKRQTTGQSSSSTNTNSSSSDKTSGIFKYFKKPSVSENKEQLVKVGCRSMDCCGFKNSKYTKLSEQGVWLECDDEAVHVIPLRQLEDKLAPNPRNSATPYLLFYVRSPRYSDGTVRLKNPNIELMDQDILYHLALGSGSHDLVEMFGDVKFVCMGGTPKRMEQFANYIMKEIGHKIPAGTTLLDISQYSYRYSMYKVGPVLSISHGMGIPSVGILLHEIIKLMYHAKVKDPIFFRIGTCGGIGLEGGTVVISEEAVDGMLNPHLELPVLGKIVTRPTKFDRLLVRELKGLAHRDDPYDTVVGKTMCTYDFYEGQARLDGAFCDFTENEKMDYLTKIQKAGVVNIEMESTPFAALTYHAGIKSAVVCVTLLDRLKGDQVMAPKEVLDEWQIRPQKLVARYITKYLQRKGRLSLEGHGSMCVKSPRRFKLVQQESETYD